MKKAFIIVTFSFIAFTTVTTNASDLCPLTLDPIPFHAALSTAEMNKAKTRKVFELENTTWFMEPDDWKQLTLLGGSKKAMTIQKIILRMIEEEGQKVRCFYTATMDSPYTTTRNPDKSSQEPSTFEFKMTYLLPEKSSQKSKISKEPVQESKVPPFRN